MTTPKTPPADGGQITLLMIEAENLTTEDVRGIADLVAGVVSGVSRVPDVPFVATPSVGRSRPRTTLPYNGMAPAVAGSATSEAAGRAIEPRRPSKRMLVYRYVMGRGREGATRKEIAAALGMSENTVRPRVCELYAQWNATYNCPEVKESPDGRERDGCAVLLAAQFYAAELLSVATRGGSDAAA